MVNDVKRYRMGTEVDGFGARGCMWPDERGLYVLSDDYDLKSAECERLRRVLAAVGPTSDYQGIQCNDVDGMNWFDARKKALTTPSQEPT